MLDILNIVEISDTNEREFHPTHISSCRTYHVLRLKKIFKKLENLTDYQKPNW